MSEAKNDIIHNISEIISFKNDSLTSGLQLYETLFEHLIEKKARRFNFPEYDGRILFIKDCILEIFTFLEKIQENTNDQTLLYRFFSNIKRHITLEEKTFPRYYHYSQESTPGELIIQGLSEVLEEFATSKGWKK